MRHRAHCARRIVCLAAVSFVALLAVGCGGGGGKGEGVIVRNPDWAFEKYERIAVIPFGSSDPKCKAAADQTSLLLEDYLTRNGTFTIVARDALKDVLTEQDLSRLSDVADPSTIIAPGKILAAQAIVIGKISECNLDTKRYERRRPIYARNQKGQIRRDRQGQPIIEREEVTIEFRTFARIAGTVRVIDTGTSQTIYSYSCQPIEAEDEARGGTPTNSPQDLAVQAARQMAEDFYKAIAPTRMTVELDTDMLVVALGYYDGKYEETNELLTTQDSFVVAVRNLPEECRRNRFRVAVSPLKAAPLWQEEFVWTGNNAVRGESYTIPGKLLIDSGQTEFQAKFYSVGDDEPLLTQDITLVPPKEEK